MHHTSYCWGDLYWYITQNWYLNLLKWSALMYYASYCWGFELIYHPVLVTSGRICTGVLLLQADVSTSAGDFWEDLHWFITPTISKPKPLTMFYVLPLYNTCHVINVLLWQYQLLTKIQLLSDRIYDYIMDLSFWCIFYKSYGHLLLLHVCSHLSAQSTHALLCLSTWSSLFDY
jgi:hypothetical protein